MRRECDSRSTTPARASIPRFSARLFTPFTQADDSTTRRFGGTGLGLSICRELAGLMNGEVGVISEVGRGSCFWAELPLVACGDSDPESVFASLPEQSGALAGLRVLIAEDNAVNMLIATALLEQWGVSVSQASDGAAGRRGSQRPGRRRHALCLGADGCADAGDGRLRRHPRAAPAP